MQSIFYRQKHELSSAVVNNFIGKHFAGGRVGSGGSSPPNAAAGPWGQARGKFFRRSGKDNATFTNECGFYICR